MGAPFFGERKALHDFVHVLVGDAAGVHPKCAGDDLRVGQIGKADDLAGVDEGVGVDGVIPVGGDLGEDAAGSSVGEAVEAGGHTAVLRAAAELDGHRREKIWPLEGARGNTGGGVPVGPTAAEFHVVAEGPAVAEVVLPIDARVALTGAHGIGGVEGAEGVIGLARELVGAFRQQVGAVAAETGKLLRVLRIAGEQVFIPVVPVVHVFAVNFHGASTVVFEEVAAGDEAVVHRITVGGAMAHGVAVEAADAVNPARPAERAAVNQVGAVMRLTAALEAEAGADFSAGTGGTSAADIVKSAAGGIGGRDGGAAAADGLDALERGVGAIEVGGVVVAEGDVGDRQAVLLHGDVILAGGAVGAVGGDAARVNHAANFAEGGIHEHPGDLEQHIVGAEIDLLGEIR
jgi:hypothetical protein